MVPYGVLARQMLERLRSAGEFRHLRAPSDVTTKDEAAFRHHAVELAADYAVLGSAFMVLAIVVWWPIDLLVQPDARHLAGFTAMRGQCLALMVVTLALFLGSEAVRRVALTAATIAYSALLGLIGHWLGWIGGPDLSWFADALFGVMPASLLPLRLGPRIVATLCIGLSLPAGFLLALAKDWHAPAIFSQLSFVAFALLITIVIGEILYRVLRGNFFQRRSLAHARAGLAELNVYLAGRVDTQSADLRALAGQLERAQETERRRISRDLHDELGQELTAMRYTLAQLERHHEQSPEVVGLFVADLGALLDGTAATVRDFLSELRPRVLEERGLVAAAESLCDRVRATGQVACRLTVAPGLPDEADGLDPDVALTLFRVLQEAATNAQRHARAQTIDLRLIREGDAITAEVQDDGIGFDVAARHAGFGLVGLRERVRGASGRLVLRAVPGGGTRVAATVPVRRVVEGRP